MTAISTLESVVGFLLAAILTFIPAGIVYTILRARLIALETELKDHRSAIQHLDQVMVQLFVPGSSSGGEASPMSRPYTRPTSSPEKYSIEDPPKRRRRAPAKAKPADLTDAHEARLEEEGFIPEDR
jgi:hypothetical protein